MDEKSFGNSEIESNLSVLKENSASWSKTDPAEKLSILEELIRAFNPLFLDWVEVSTQEKWSEYSDQLASEEWFSGPVGLARCLKYLETDL